MRKLSVLVALLLFGATMVSAQSTSEGDPEPRRRVRTYELTINTNVRDAEVYLDGRLQRGRTPLTLSLREGTYTVRVEARGYEIFTERVYLDRDKAIYARLIAPVAIVQLRIPNEFLNHDIRDPWREIDLYVDGRLRRESRVEVEPGWHDIAIVSGGLRIEKEFRFEAGRTYTIDLLLQATMNSRWEN